MKTFQDDKGMPFNNLMIVFTKFRFFTLFTKIDFVIINDIIHLHKVRLRIILNRPYLYILLTVFKIKKIDRVKTKYLSVPIVTSYLRYCHKDMAIEYVFSISTAL